MRTIGLALIATFISGVFSGAQAKETLDPLKQILICPGFSVEYSEKYEGQVINFTRGIKIITSAPFDKIEFDIDGDPAIINVTYPPDATRSIQPLTFTFYNHMCRLIQF